MSLPASIGGTWEQQWNDTVKMLGVEAQHKANAGGALTTIYCGMQKPKSTDVVNAYEERDWILTIRAMDLAIKPVKFDSIVTADGREYTISKAKEIYLNATLIGWKAVASG